MNIPLPNLSQTGTTTSQISSLGQARLCRVLLILVVLDNARLGKARLGQTKLTQIRLDRQLPGTLSVDEFGK